MTNVMKRVKKHYDRAVEHYGEEAVLGVFCYGSWNYNTNTLESDVDTKCILIPDIYHLALKPYEVKHLHIWTDGDKDFEVCECMTIMHMVNNWKKQNVNFVEIMFTPYHIINPMYVEVWNRLFPMEMRERIARYDIRQAIHSMTHQAIHTLKQNPNDNKKYMNGVRIATTLTKLTETQLSYWDCIWMPTEVRKLRFEPHTQEQVEELLNLFEKYLKHIECYSDIGSFKPAIDRQLEELILKLIEFRTRGLHF